MACCLVSATAHRHLSTLDPIVRLFEGVDDEGHCNDGKGNDRLMGDYSIDY